MARKSGKIYRVRNPVSIIVSVILTVVLILVITAVIVFFAFQKYIVYTENGVRLEVPWLEETYDRENGNFLSENSSYNTEDNKSRTSSF